MIQYTFALLLVCSALTEWKEYVNTEKKYKFKYPDTWTQRDMGTATAFLSPLESERDSFMENINIITEDLTMKPMTLEQYSEVSVNGLKYDIGSAGILSLKDTMLAGHKAKELIFIMNKTQKVKIKQFFTVKDNIAYLFSYTAEPAKFEQYEGIATEAMQSLEFIQ